MKRLVFAIIIVLLVASLPLRAVCLALPDCTMSKEELRLFSQAREQERILDESGFLYADPGLESYLEQVASKLEGGGDLISLLGPGGLRAAISGYTRKFEAEADLVGLKMAAKAGYDIVEALRLFEYLRKEIEINDTREPFFFATHPKLQGRIENCKGFIKNHPSLLMSGVKNTREFLARTQELVLENAKLDLKAGRFDTARTGIEKYLAISPNDARAHFVLGEIFRQRARRGDIEKALRSYETAISLAPFYPEPYEAMGLIYYKEGRMGLARVSFETCLALSTNLPDRAYIESYVRKWRQ